MTPEEQKEIIDRVSIARQQGKTAGYAAVYGGGPSTIALGAKIPLETAKKLHEAYWKIHWSVKAIAEEQYVFEDSRGDKWLVNPINGFCYSLRKESDRFSTLAQGTGSYIFDMWIDKVLDKMYQKHGVKRLTASFHDEQVIVIKDNKEARMSLEVIIKESLEEINREYNIRREMGCDVQFGKRYSEIH